MKNKNLFDTHSSDNDSDITTTPRKKSQYK